MRIRYCTVNYQYLVISKIDLQYFLALGRPWTALWDMVLQQHCFIYRIYLKTVPFCARNPPFQGFLPLFYRFISCLVFVCRIWHLWSKVVTVQYVAYSRFCICCADVFFYLVYKLFWKNAVFDVCKISCIFYDLVIISGRSKILQVILQKILKFSD